MEVVGSEDVGVEDLDDYEANGSMDMEEPAG